MSAEHFHGKMIGPATPLFGEAHSGVLRNRESTTANDSAPAIDLPREAAAHVMQLANREKAVQKRGWDHAWNYVRAVEPALFFLMNRDHPDTMPKRLANRAAAAGRRFGALCNRAVATEGMSYEAAERFIREREPLAYERMAALHEESQISIPFHLTPRIVAKRVSDAFRSLRNEFPGADFAALWEAFKLRDPELFAVLCAFSEEIP